jgi:hypothetical protein
MCLNPPAIILWNKIEDWKTSSLLVSFLFNHLSSLYIPLHFGISQCKLIIIIPETLLTLDRWDTSYNYAIQFPLNAEEPLENLSVGIHGRFIAAYSIQGSPLL